MARARQPRVAQQRLHARLVAKITGRIRRQAGDPLLLADLGQRHLELLVGRDQPVDRTESVLQLSDRLLQLGSVEHIDDAPMGDLRADRGRKILEGRLADHTGAHIREPRDRGDHARRILGEDGRGEQNDRHGGPTLTRPAALWNPSGRTYIIRRQCHDFSASSCPGGAPARARST